MPTSTMRRKLIVVIPAYDAGEFIKGVVDGIPNSITSHGQVFDTDVVVIDDGSKDNTYAQALKTRALVMRHVMNSGAGAATRTGLKYVQSLGGPVNFVVTIDSDGQHDVKDIRNLLDCAIETNADIVVGNRLHGGNRETMPSHRKLGNRGLSLISRLLFGIKVEDTQSGLRLYATSSLPHISNYTIDRYGFCTESLWLAKRAKLTIQETPTTVSYSDERLSSGQSNWGAIDLILDLLWVRMVE
jgi:glycosyltransferase involved in cell wall biosynthesis